MAEQPEIEAAVPATDISETKQDAGGTKAQADKLIAEGKKAIALKDWEVGVEKYAGALDLMRELVGEFDPAMAPLLLSYGKALYELAFSTQGVMGKEEVEKTALAPGQSVEDVPATFGNFVFEGDGDDVNEEDDGNAEAGPSSGNNAANDTAEQERGEDAGNGEGEGDGEGDGEAEGPEDDYNAAWEVLDVARTIYSKIVEDLPEGQGKEESLCLADCYLSLGDVSLETENFPQAAQDYTSALRIKSTLLSPSSRSLASVHYQLATVLEFTPDGRTSALTHVQHAVTGFKARLAELDGETSLSPELAKMSETERENERKDVRELIGDLEVKIEELKAAPESGDPVSESIKHLLGGTAEAAFGAASGSGSANGVGETSGPVNDLTSMVKKKKKAPAAATPVPATESNGVDGKGQEGDNGEKRKLGETADAEASSKRARVEDA